MQMQGIVNTWDRARGGRRNLFVFLLALGMFHVLSHLVLTQPIAQMVKNWLVMQETRVRPLGWEVPLEKGMAIHSRIFAWRIPWTEKPGGRQPVGSQRVRND